MICYSTKLQADQKDNKLLTNTSLKMPVSFLIHGSNSQLGQLGQIGQIGRVPNSFFSRRDHQPQTFNKQTTDTLVDYYSWFDTDGAGAYLYACNWMVPRHSAYDILLNDTQLNDQNKDTEHNL
jgi:hypothetical protein